MTALAVCGTRWFSFSRSRTIPAAEYSKISQDFNEDLRAARSDAVRAILRHQQLWTTRDDYALAAAAFPTAFAFFPPAFRYAAQRLRVASPILFRAAALIFRFFGAAAFGALLP